MQNENFYDEMPSLEKLQETISGLDSRDETARKNMDQRAENYYNCLDDYSYGGICDRAAVDGISERGMQRRALQEQIENGAFVEVFKSNVLLYQGKVVSDRVVNGRFGPCWIIPGEKGSAPGFVSVAKKASTYEKKGFEVKTREIKLEYYYTGGQFQKNGHLKFKSRILSDEITNEFNEYASTGFCFMVWLTLKNQDQPEPVI